MDVNFSITSKTLSNKDIITTIEDAVKDLEKMLTQFVAKYPYTPSSKPPANNCTRISARL